MTEIHGGPHTLYGWSPVWEFQILAANGMGVFYCNPRGSEGYGEAFNDANHRDWGPGPMRDVLAGVESLVDDGLADPERLGVTGGSYGGYLTNWIDRPRRPLRGGDDLPLGQRHDDALPDRRHQRRRVGQARVRGDALGRSGLLPRDLADQLRAATSARRCSSSTRSATCACTVGQAEALFTVLRSLKRPVRLLRVPEETHELTRSGTPYRRDREPRHRARLVQPLPRGRQARAAAPAQGPRRPLAA